MNCPVCGSEIPSGSKYCSVCGTDVEGAQQRARQAAPQQAVLTQQMPRQQRPAPQAVPTQGYRQPSGHAVPMNPSMPPQQGVTRDFDTSKMGGSPKWPIVVICALVVVIAAIVLLIFQPWSSLGNGGDSQVDTDGELVTPVTSDDEEDAAEVSEASDEDASTALTEQEAYDQLSAVYDQFSGFNDRIVEIVDFFGAYFGTDVDSATLQSWLDTATALQSELAAQTATLDAIQLAEDSAYTETLANLKTLNNDLVMRTADLADALQAWVNGASSDEVGTYLTRNNQNGASVYLTEYNNLYPNAQPVAPQE